MNVLRRLLVSIALLGIGLPALAAPTVTTLRATELRSDKLAAARVLGPLKAGATLQLLSVEGGWALVETAGMQPQLSGWVRASSLDWKAGAASTAGLLSGRQADGNHALMLGVRSLAPRVNRHALIIGISRYADAATPPLPGARIDKESATQMAQAMQVPLANIQYLQDEQATGDNIREALRELTARVQTGDRVFIHYSGHGTRYADPAAGGCVEALLAYDGGTSGTLTNHEMAELLRPITNKTDKLFVMYDACHSGGVGQTAIATRTRGWVNANDEGVLRPKSAAISEECSRAVNVRTRNLVVEATARGALAQDIVHLSASHDNEISFDDALKGGLATQYMRDCMLRDARDLDGSGAVSIDEIRQCAQQKIDRRMAGDPNYKAHNLLLTGNAEFVPAWFALPLPVATAVPAMTAMPAAPVAPAAPIAPVAAAVAIVTPAPPPPSLGAPPLPPAMVPALATNPATTAPALPPLAALAPLPAGAAPAPLSGEQALRQMFEQRDAKRRVHATLVRERLRIGQDRLELSVDADRAGYLYVAMAGSDNRSIHLLFPNDLDAGNRIEPGQTLHLPRNSWEIKAAGPAGVDHLLVLVSDGPRDLAPLAATKAGPFVASLNDAQGRARLGALMSASRAASGEACSNAIKRFNNPQCSDAYGAAMLAVEEVLP